MNKIQQMLYNTSELKYFLLVIGIMVGLSAWSYFYPATYAYVTTILLTISFLFLCPNKRNVLKKKEEEKKPEEKANG